MGVAKTDWRDYKSLETWRNMLQKHQPPAAQGLLTSISKHEPQFLNVVANFNVFYKKEDFLGQLFIFAHAGLDSGCLPYTYQAQRICLSYCKNSYSMRSRFLQTTKSSLRVCNFQKVEYRFYHGTILQHSCDNWLKCRR